MRLKSSNKAIEISLYVSLQPPYCEKSEFCEYSIMSNNNTKDSSRASGTDYTLSPGAPEFALCCVYKHYKGFVYFDYTYRLISIAYHHHWLEYKCISRLISLPVVNL
jgi:hypothetical protein